jgi:hypothetical protein
MHSLRATQDATFLALPATEWAEALREWFPLPIHLLEGLVVGMRRTSTITSERERLLALGSLSAGLTHELNNPAAAAQRATESLRSRVAGMRHKLGLLACGKLDGETIAQLVDLQEDAVSRAETAPDLSVMAKARTYERHAAWYMEPALWLTDIFTAYQEAGPDYIVALLTGYSDPPEGMTMAPGMNYNKAFPGHQIAMPNPLSDGQVTYEDGTPATVENYAKDVTAFLMWTAEPKLEERKRMGIESLPGSLGAAIEHASESEFLLKALGEHAYSRLLDLKRKEWDAYRVQVSPWELKEYLSVL